MVTLHTGVPPRKMPKNIYFLAVLVLGYTYFLTPVFAVSYGSGAYNTGVYGITAPVITSISANVISTDQVQISWSTDEPADSQIEYGTTSSYGSTTTLDASLVSSHSVSISGLSPATIYNYRVVSRDADLNTARSSNQVFTTNSLPAGAVLLLPQINPVCTNSSSCSGVAPSKTIQTSLPPMLTKTLSLGKVDREVQLLQVYLNSKGFYVSKKGVGSPGKETNIFGSATKKALIAFQKAHNILPATGNVGPKTREFFRSQR